MITHDDIALAEYLIRETGAAEILLDGMQRSNRGRKSNNMAGEFLLLGLLLSIQHHGVATIQGAHRVLTEEIPLDEQLRLGSRYVKDGEMVSLTAKTLYNQADRIKDLLAYGEKSTPDLDDTERVRRRSVLNTFSNTLMDVFDLGWESDTFALDATGIPSWALGGKTREKIHLEDFEGDDDNAIAELLRKATLGDALEAEEEEVDIEGLELEEEVDDENKKKKRPRRRRRDRLMPRKRPAGINPKSASDDDGLGWTNSADPDAHWGLKTSKDGSRKSFFGYHEHTLVLAPEGSLEKFPDAEPVLIRRMELTRAGEDIVAVSLRMIDSLRNVKHLIVDNLYHHKKPERWLDELDAREVHQHHDLRSDEQGFIDYERVRWAAGSPHCPGCEDDLGVIPRPGPGASHAANATFIGQIERREIRALRVINRPKGDQPGRFQCPVRAGKAGCALVPGSVATAIEKGLPIIENPPNEERDGEPLPKICVQETATLTPPAKVRKLRQLHYWGSKPWREMFRRRTSVEGTYGNRKNVSTENLGHGLYQTMGITWTYLIASLVATSYNVRIIQNWHERSGKGDPNHPLFLGEKGRRAWMFLSPEDEARVEALFAESLGVGPAVSE